MTDETKIDNPFKGMSPEELARAAYHAVIAGVNVPEYTSFRSQINLFLAVGDKERAQRLTREKAEDARKKGNLEEELEVCELQALCSPHSKWEIKYSEFYARMAKVAYKLGEQDKAKTFFQETMQKPEDLYNYNSTFVYGNKDLQWVINDTRDLGNHFLGLAKVAFEIGLPKEGDILRDNAGRVIQQGLSIIKLFKSSQDKIYEVVGGIELIDLLPDEDSKKYWKGSLALPVLEKLKALVSDKNWVKTHGGSDWIIRKGYDLARKYLGYSFVNQHEDLKTIRLFEEALNRK